MAYKNNGGVGSINVTAHADFVISDDLSFSCYFRFPSNAHNSNERLYQVRNTTQNYILRIVLTGTASNDWDIQYAHQYGAGLEEGTTFQSNIANDTWVHMAWIRDVSAKTVKCYKDLTLVSTLTYTNDPTTTATVLPIYIASDNPSGNEIRGEIAEVVLANKAWTDDELTASKVKPSSIANNIVQRMSLVGLNTTQFNKRDTSGKQHNASESGGTQTASPHPNVTQLD